MPKHWNELSSGAGKKATLCERVKDALNTRIKNALGQGLDNYWFLVSSATSSGRDELVSSPESIEELGEVLGWSKEKFIMFSTKCMFCDSAPHSNTPDDPFLCDHLARTGAGNTRSQESETAFATSISEAALLGQTTFNCEFAGFKGAPPHSTLLPAVPIENWLPPTLHILLGLVCRVYLALICFIEFYVKQTEESKEIKHECLRKAADYLHQSLHQEVDEDQMRAEARYDDLLTKTDHNDDDTIRDEMQGLINEFSFQVNSSGHRIDTHKDSLQTAELEALKSQLEVEHFNAKDEAVDVNYNPTWMAIASILRSFGIDASVHFGGTLVGRHCDAFMEKATEIFEEIRPVLLNAVQLNKKGHRVGSNPNELLDAANEFCDDMTSILQYLHSIFTTIRNRNVCSTEAVDELQQTTLPEFGKLWARMCDKKWNGKGPNATEKPFTTTAPKLHVLLSHTPYFIRNIGRLGLLVEQHVESLHHLF